MKLMPATVRAVLLFFFNTKLISMPMRAALGLHTSNTLLDAYPPSSPELRSRVYTAGERNVFSWVKIKTRQS